MSLDQLSSNSTQASNIDTPKKTRSWAWLLPTGLVLGFLLIFMLLFGKRFLPAVEVKTAEVITTRITVEETASSPAISESSPPIKGAMIFQASGWIEPDPYVTYVPALTNGVIDKVHVLEGQKISKGELLATLINDDATLQYQHIQQEIKSLQAAIKAHCVGVDISQAEINTAKKKIDASRALMANAEDNLKRLEKLPLSAVPERQVMQARFAKTRHIALVAEAEAAIPQFKAKLKQIEQERISMESNLQGLKIKEAEAKLALDRTKIHSPMDGIVLRLFVAPGKKRSLAMDDPNSAVIVSLYDPKKLQARIDIPLSEAAHLEINQAVELTSDILPNQVFKGLVTRIGGKADIQRNTLQAKVKINTPDARFRPEMLVRAKFFSVSKQSASKNSKSTHPARFALYVPTDSIIREKEIWVVSSNNTAEKRTVKLHPDTQEGHRRVLEGVRSGEHVILPPFNHLTEGTRIKTQP